MNEQVLYPNILEVNRSCNFSCCLLAKATACHAAGAILFCIEEMVLLVCYLRASRKVITDIIIIIVSSTFLLSGLLVDKDYSFILILKFIA